MATLQGGPINTGDYERTQMEGKPLPPGIYKGVITRTAQKDTNGKAGPGVMVEVEFDITWPEEFANRKFWDGFNIINPNPKTMEIGKECLADLGKAAGFPILQDDEELMGREVIMELYIKKGDDWVDPKTGQTKTGRDKNKCGKYWSPDTNIEEAKKARKEASKTASAPTSQPTAAPRPAAPPVANKWGGQKPPAAPAAPAAPPPVAQAAPVAPPAAAPAAPPVAVTGQQAAPAAPDALAAAPAGPPAAPWKRPK